MCTVYATYWHTVDWTGGTNISGTHGKVNWGSLLKRSCRYLVMQWDIKFRVREEWSMVDKENAKRLEARVCVLCVSIKLRIKLYSDKWERSCWDKCVATQGKEYDETNVGDLSRVFVRQPNASDTVYMGAAPSTFCDDTDVEWDYRVLIYTDNIQSAELFYWHVWRIP